jgi:hypothetical protein
MKKWSLLFTMLIVAACGTTPLERVTPSAASEFAPAEARPELASPAAPAANWPTTDYSVFNTGVDYHHTTPIPSMTQVCWPTIAMFHNGHYGVPTWPNGHPKNGARITSYGSGATPQAAVLATALGITFEHDDAYAYGAARCSPWSNFEEAWNPGWVLHAGLSVFEPDDGPGPMTKSQMLWQSDAFCYLNGWSAVSHANESAKVERVSVPGTINGLQWRFSITGSAWTSAGAQCIYLGRPIEILPMRSATQQLPNMWMQLGPDDGICVINAVTGNTDNGSVIMGVANNQYGIPLYRLSVGGGVTSAQGYCVRWWAPWSIQHPALDSTTH